MKKVLHIWKRFHAVWDIPFSLLEENNIQLIVLDRDNTVYDRAKKDIPEAAREWVRAAKKAGFSLYIISNNFDSIELDRTAEILGTKKIDHAMKPLPFALERVCKEEGFSPENTVMIGDQIFTDIASGNLAGAKTILIDHLSNREFFLTYILRLFERFAERGAPYTSGAELPSNGRKHEPWN